MAALTAITGVTTTITTEVDAAAVVETITTTEEVEIAWVEVTTKEVITAVAAMAGAIIITIDTIHKATTMAMVEVTTEAEAEADITIANELIETIGMVVMVEAMTTRAPAIIINTTIITITTIIRGWALMIQVSRCTAGEATSTVTSSSKWVGL